jgi:hypothetical protein
LNSRHSRSPYYHIIDHSVGPAIIMVLQASEFLKTEELGPLTRSIISFCVVLDDAGAWTWNLRIVAVITAIILGGIRIAFGNKRGVNWISLLHALVTAVGSLACVYLDFQASVTLTGTAEPLRSLQCHGPLTSLHRILPAITVGYAVFDILDGFRISTDFLLHGLATISVTGYFCEIGGPQIVVGMLLMEVSTLFLTLVKADFMSVTMMIYNQAAFVLSFFMFRVVLCPYIWFLQVYGMWTLSSTEEYKSCRPRHMLGFTLVSGLFFHVLNAYWFIKIVKKVLRKMRGEEKVDAKNDLSKGDHLDPGRKKKL